MTYSLTGRTIEVAAGIAKLSSQNGSMPAIGRCKRWGIAFSSDTAATQSQVLEAVHEMARFALVNPEEVRWTDLDSLRHSLRGIVCREDSLATNLTQGFWRWVGHEPLTIDQVEEELEVAAQQLWKARIQYYSKKYQGLSSGLNCEIQELEAIPAPSESQKVRLGCLRMIQSTVTDLLAAIAQVKVKGEEAVRILEILELAEEELRSAQLQLNQVSQLEERVARLEKTSVAKRYPLAYLEVQATLSQGLNQLAVTFGDPDEFVKSLTSLQHRVDRATVKMLASPHLLGKGGRELNTALRFSRKDPSYPLRSSHYVVQDQGEIRVLRYLHSDEVKKKEPLNKHGLEARVYELEDAQGRRGYIRRRAIHRYAINVAASVKAPGVEAEAAAKALHGLHPKILCGYAVPGRKGSQKGLPVREILMERMDSDVFALREAGVYRGNRDRVVCLLLQIAEALSALHEHDWIHQDIKQENIMFVSRQLDSGGEFHDYHLVDFGFASHLDEGQPVLARGTPATMAPELFHGTGFVRGPEGGKKTDVFSLACVGLELLKNKQLNPRGAYQRARRRTKVGPVRVLYSDLQANGFSTPEALFQKYGELGRVLSEMLNPDPAKRPTMDQVVERLRHLSFEIV